MRHLNDGGYVQPNQRIVHLRRAAVKQARATEPSVVDEDANSESSRLYESVDALGARRISEIGFAPFGVDAMSLCKLRAQFRQSCLRQVHQDEIHASPSTFLGDRSAYALTGSRDKAVGRGELRIRKHLQLGLPAT